ncbi:MAG TPA: tetratricopeptide repeat protein, partial [Rhodospirillales bacterium]|nr:tetratricopeptide repeat protein [Rhodospirillales bacterium]
MPEMQTIMALFEKPRTKDMTRKVPAFGLLGLIFALVEPSVAVAQSRDLQPMLDRLQRLERDIRTLNIALARKGSGGTPALVSGSIQAAPSNSTGLARLDARLGELEQELRAGTGKVEEMTYTIQQINQRLEKLVADIDYRLSALESRPVGSAGSASRINAATTPTGVQQVVPGATPAGVLGTLTGSDMNAAPPAGAGGPVAAIAVSPVPAKPVSVLPKGSPKEKYSYAFSLLQKAEYERAEAAFTEFVDRHGDDPLVGNARYWLGETYYVRGQYVKAA